MEIEKINFTKLLGLSLNLEKVPEWTQDYIDIQYIRDGVIVVKENRRKRYIKILEISAINMEILTPQEQDMVIDEYVNLLKTGPDNFQIKIVTKEVDVKEYINTAEKAYFTEESEKCKEAIANYISNLRGEDGLESFKKHYYYIFEYYGNGNKTEEEKIDILNNKAQEIKAEFLSIGNDVVCFDSVVNENKSNSQIAELLYQYFNRRTSYSENFRERANRIIDDAKKINNVQGVDELPPVEFKNLIAPKSMDFNESPNYMVIDGLYRAHYIVKGNSIPTNICTLNSWLRNLQMLGYGFDIDIFYKKQDASEKLRSIRSGIKISRMQTSQAREEDSNYSKVHEGFRGNMFMKTALTEWKEELYEMTVLVTLNAFTLEELYKRIDILKKIELTSEIKLISAKRFQEEAFKSTGFTHYLLPKIENIGKRNVTTQGVAAAYPYLSFSMMDKEGVAIGSTINDNSLIMYDPFDKKYTNSNIAIYGASGHGKTYTLLTLTTRLRYLGVQNFIIAPLKQHEFIRTCNAVGGSFIDLASTSKNRINALDIIPMQSPSSEILDGEGYQEKDWLTDKIINLKTWLKHLIPSLSVRNASSQARLVALENILIALYGEYGITNDNDSVWEDEEHTKVKKMPILGDFYNKVKEHFGEEDDITVILSQFIFGSAKSLNGETNVDLSNKYIVFGVENIEADLLAPTMFIILDYIWSKCRENRTLKKMITIDEGWKMLRGNDGEVGSFVEEIFKTIRGFGGGAIFATQSILDLYDGKNNYGNAILSCSHSKIILGMEQKDLDAISEELGLTLEEQNRILKFKEKGLALFCAGTNHIPIKVKASSYEHELFTTSRADLEKMVDEKKGNENE